MVKRRLLKLLAFCCISLACSPMSGDAISASDLSNGGQSPANAKLEPGSKEMALPQSRGQNDNLPQDKLQKEAAFNEIMQIRQRLGGSVLQGSSLDTVGEGAPSGFDSRVRAQLGLPEKPRPVVPDDANQHSSTDLSAVGAFANNGKIVALLRSESKSLCGIADELETLRQYNHADALRAIANKLRLAARQLDVALPQTKNSSDLSNSLEDWGSLPRVRSSE